MVSRSSAAPWVSASSAAFRLLVVREEHETALVVPLEEHQQRAEDPSGVDVKQAGSTPADRGLLPGPHGTDRRTAGTKLGSNCVFVQTREHTLSNRQQGAEGGLDGHRAIRCR